MRVSSSIKFVLVVGTLAGSIAWAQKPPAAPAPAPVVGSCPSVPYSVGEAATGGEIAARFDASVLNGLLKLPNVTARTGYEVVKTAYAGMSSQAMSAVFAAWQCRISAYIDGSKAVDADAKKAAVRKAITQLNIHMAVIQNAAGLSTDSLDALGDKFLNMETRSESAPVLDAAITQAALASIDPNALFIDKITKSYWLTLNVGAKTGVSACGGVVKAAISDGGSALQASLASTKSILIDYLDPTLPPAVALSNLLVAASVSPIKPSVSPGSTFKNCTEGLLAQQRAAADIAKNQSAPVPPSEPASGPK